MIGHYTVYQGVEYGHDGTVIVVGGISDTRLFYVIDEIDQTPPIVDRQLESIKRLLAARRLTGRLAREWSERLKKLTEQRRLQDQITATEQRHLARKRRPRAPVTRDVTPPFARRTCSQSSRWMVLQ